MPAEGLTFAAMRENKKVAGVIGAGSFGTALTTVLMQNAEVWLYSRNPEQVEEINRTRTHFGVHLPEHVHVTCDLARVAAACRVIFPVVPSANFREMMKDLGGHLRPEHILIHGTKGFDITAAPPEEEWDTNPLRPEHVRTMSQVIREESPVVRVGCLSGPNLAAEILEGQPTATVIASRFLEVTEAGKRLLSSRSFQVFGTFEILGAELAGVLKNTIAIGAGILAGMGLGKNIQAALITRGLNEMIYIGKAFGASPKAFVGTAGIGDLVCTATSEKSRNFTFGKRLGMGESPEHIMATMPELAEGVRTLKVVWHLARHFQLNVPINQMLYRVVFENYPIDKAIEFLMRYPYYVDVDFLD